MSGIVAMIRTDGAPLEPALIDAATCSLRLRGPDARRSWCKGSVGLGHTLLRTSDQQSDEQPLSLDGVSWIVADARLDARSNLIEALGPGHRPESGSGSDAELILRAFHRWGSCCVERLLGDFTFAIWNEDTRSLFCARDHMGVKPAFYASCGHWLLLGSTLEVLRQHRAVSDALNDRAIADFLLFGLNYDPETTSFRDIARLPAAHTLSWADGRLDIRRYWSFPIEEPLRRRRSEDYVEEFLDLSRTAVSDRLSTNRVSVFMSGGLDSSSLAATSLNLLGMRGPDYPVRAFTFLYEMMPDSEREYAGAVAQHLNIPINYYTVDRGLRWEAAAAVDTPEPTQRLTNSVAADHCHSDMVAHSPVALYGEGPDNALLNENGAYLKYMIRTRAFPTLVRDVTGHLIQHRHLPSIGSWRHILGRRPSTPEGYSSMLGWVNPDLVGRLGLRERCHDINRRPELRHPVRPVGHASLSSPLWQRLFESGQPSYTGVSLEVRHPYVDIRLLRFLLRVPVLPWCRRKHLLRRAFRGTLPSAVIQRDKAPLTADPRRELGRRVGLPVPAMTALAGRYINLTRVSEAAELDASGVVVRAVALSHWLQPHHQVGPARRSCHALSRVGA